MTPMNEKPFAGSMVKVTGTIQEERGGSAHSGGRLMGIYEFNQQFAGKPVINWDANQPLADAGNHVYRISIDWDDSEAGEKWTDRLAMFLDDPASAQVTGLIVGFWGGEPGDESAAPVVEALVAARDRLPLLNGLFLGEILAEECEISWIAQTDVSPLFEAYPKLECFRVRGSTGLRLGAIRHARLKELAIECGGLGRDLLHDVFASELPELEHLELWLGAEGYGAEATVDDLAPLLSGELFPKLTYLGLRDSEITDDIAGVLANAPVLERLEVLDLSLGTFGNGGAAALLASPHAPKLKKLDIHHHYCSDEMIERLRGLGIEVEASEHQTPDDWGDGEHRFVAVGE
jgi:hypothetical protein